MVEYDQFVCDMGDFLESEELLENFLNFVNPDLKEEYKNLIESR